MTNFQNNSKKVRAFGNIGTDFDIIKPYTKIKSITIKNKTMEYIAFYPSSKYDEKINELVKSASAEQILTILIAIFDYCNLSVFEVSKDGAEEFSKFFNTSDFKCEIYNSDYQSLVLSMDKFAFDSLVTDYKRDFIVMDGGVKPTTYCNGKYIDVHSTKGTALNECGKNDKVICAMSILNTNSNLYDVHIFDDDLNEIIINSVNPSDWDSQTKNGLDLFFNNNSHRNLCSELTDEEYDYLMEVIDNYEFSYLKEDDDLRNVVSNFYEKARYVVFKVIKVYGFDYIFKFHKNAVELTKIDGNNCLLFGDAFSVAECVEDLKKKYSDLF